GFYERLIGGDTLESEPKIPVNAFFGLVHEIERGKMTKAQVIAILNLSAAEQVDAGNLIDKVISLTEASSIGGFNQLTNIGAAYDSTSNSQGLGIMRLELSGITGVEFTVRVNKIGTGVQDWQLWNETDGGEIVLISDNGAAGVKTLSNTR